MWGCGNTISLLDTLKDCMPLLKSLRISKKSGYSEEYDDNANEMSLPVWNVMYWDTGIEYSYQMLCQIK
jgi:hypothetical protein